MKSLSAYLNRTLPLNKVGIGAKAVTCNAAKCQVFFSITFSTDTLISCCMSQEGAVSLSSLESIEESINSSASHDGPLELPDQGAHSSEEIDRPKSNTSTVKSNRVPLLKRRGLLAQVTVLPEYEDPRDYPSGYKAVIVTIVAFAAICGPMGTSIMLPAIDDIVADLDTSVSIVNVSVGIYLLTLGIFPLWWSAFSERHGRRNVYIVSFTLFVCFSIGCALAPSIAALIIFRVFAGACSASVQAVGAGTIGDLYIQSNRGKAMGWYYLGPLMGPFLAPILGGVVAEVWGWRATQWVLVIASGIADVLIIFGLPETLRKQDNMANIRKLLAEAMQDKLSDEKSNEETSSRRSTEIIQTVMSHMSPEEETPQEEYAGVGDSIMPSLSRLTTNRSSYSKRIAKDILQNQISREMSQMSMQKKTGWALYKSEAYEFLIRPTHSLVLLKYPPVLLIIMYSACSFAVIYFFNMTISYMYARKPYHFKTIIVGLLYIPNSVTYVAASILGGRWNDYLLRRYAEKHNGELKPESRISWNVLTAVILYPPSMLLFGWSLDKGLHWVVPLVGTSIFGFASMLVIGATVTYLVDTLPGKGATGVALNNLIRQILAAIATFVVEPLIDALGTGVLFSILTGIITVSVIFIVILKRKGDTIRAKYDLTEFYDKL